MKLALIVEPSVLVLLSVILPPEVSESMGS